MQETIEEKEVLSWLAGFYDAEGCVRVNKSVRKNGYTTYRPVVVINNTDVVTIDYCISLLKNHNINMHVHESSPTTTRQKIKYVEVSRITKVIELCDLLMPYLITKYDEFKLIREFCMSRKHRFIESGVKNNKLFYNDYEIGLYEKLVEYKAHKKGRKCLHYVPLYSDTTNNVTWSWFSGYTDGDGSFNINKRGSASYCVGTTSLTTSDKLKRFFICNNIKFYFYSRLPAKNHLTTCKLRMFTYFVNNTDDILCILRNVNSYVVSKLNATNLMFEYCELRNKNKGKWRTDYEKSFVERMKVLTLR